MGAPFPGIRAGLKCEVLSERNARRFAEARQEHAVLRPYGTVQAVLDLLGDEAPDRYGERDAVVRVLLEEQQARPDRFWSSVLVLVFMPMLIALRNRIYGDRLEDCDLDQVVLASFLDAVRSLPLERFQERTCMYLRQTTQRAVFDNVRKEQQEQALVEGTGSLADLERRSDLSDEPWTPVHTRIEKRSKPAGGGGATFVLELRRLGGLVVGPEQIELVIATSVQGESLRDYIVRLNPDMPGADRKRLYERLKRQRTRTIGRLREVFLDPRLSPDRRSGTLPLWDSSAGTGKA